MRKTDSIWILKSNLKENDVEDIQQQPEANASQAEAGEPKTHAD
jgi:hypothetical protein